MTYNSRDQNEKELKDGRRPYIYVFPPREFISKVFPFEYLREEELDYVVKNLKSEAFGEGEKIFDAGEDPKKIYIVFSGSVGLYEGEDLVREAREGDIIYPGFEERKKYSAVTHKETICFTIPVEVFTYLLNKNEKFRESFRYLNERHFRKLLGEQIYLEQLLYSDLKVLIVKKAVVCSPSTSIREAVKKMIASGVGSIVVVDENGKPMGILTSADLRKIIAQGINPEERVSSYMSKPPITMDSKKPIYEAYIELIRRGIDHLIITENDQVLGVITSKDLLSYLEPSSSIIVQTRKISKSKTIEELTTIYQRIKKTVVDLVLRHVHFYDISLMISESYDHVMRKVIELVRGDFEREYGKLPNFVWVTMGSAGRKEEVIATDQDNAIISDAGSELLIRFAERVNDSLEKIGIPKCRGGFMASNPRWNKDIESWKSYFRKWFRDLEPEDVRNLTIFLDMRPVYGHVKLYRELFEYVLSIKSFQVLKALAYDALILGPPGKFERRKTLDLKKSCIYPIINSIRVLALEANVEATNTRERIENLLKLGVLDHKMANSILNSYEFIQDLRLRTQVDSFITGKDLPNELKIDELNRVESVAFWESLRIIKELQEFIRWRYDVRI
jgi:CBS domain-containing protein